MIHVRAMKVPRGNKAGPLYGYYASSGFGPPNAKEQIRRGVIMATVASVMVLVGSLLTWLVYTEVFGSKVPIMGPLVISLGVLLVVLSVRQFFVVWQQKKNPPTADKKDTAAEDEEMPCDRMLEMETWDGEKPSYLQNYQQMRCYNPRENIKSILATPPSCTLLPNSSSSTAIVPYYQPFVPVPVPYYQPRTDLPLHPHPPPPHPPPPLSPSADATTTTTTTTMTVMVVNADDTPKVKSCCDLSGMARSVSMEAPNPRPVIRYSQGQLELLDKEAAAMGCTSPTLVASTPSRTSLGERSTSPHERISHKSLSLSIERTDILETI